MTTNTSDTDTAAPRFEQLTLTAVKPHAKNVRRSVGGLVELTESIKAQGVLQPLVVAPGKKAGTYTLITGHRRAAAAKRAGLKTLPCVVRDDLDTEAKQIEAMLVENLQRSDLDPIEEGDAYQSLLDLNIPYKEIAETTGRAQKTVRERVKVASASELVRNKVIDKQLSLEDAVALEGFADDKEAYERIANYIGTNNFEWALKQAKIERAFQKEAAKIRAELLAEGVIEYDKDECQRIVDEAAATGNALKWVGPTDDRPADAKPDDLAFYFWAHGSASAISRMRWMHLVPADTPGGKVTNLADERTSRDDEADRIARAKLEADLAIAHTVRREHLSKAVTAGEKDLAHSCLVQMIAVRFDEDPDDVDLVAALLAVKPPVWGGDEDDDDRLAKVRERVEQAIERLTINQLAILLRVVERDLADISLKRASSWAWSDSIAWCNELSEKFGYEWSDVEAALVDATKPAKG